MTVKSPPQKGRRRLATCKKHHLHYDPSLQSGCVLCRKENPLGSVRNNRPILGWLAVLGAAALIAAYFGFDRGQTPAAETSEATEALFDPEVHRTQLTILESTIYQDKLASAADAARASTAATVLATELRQRDTTYVGDLAARRLEEFRDQISASTPPFDLAPVRESWRQVRAEVFAEAAWFRQAPVAALTTGNSADDVSAMTGKMTSFADRLTTFAATARQELAAFDNRSDPDRVAKHADWASRWPERVGKLREELPALIQGSDPGVALAHAELENALAALDQLASGEIPDAAQRELSLEQVTSAASAAQNYLVQAALAAP